MANDLLYRIALTLVPQVGPVQAKILLQQAEPEEIFKARTSFLEKIEGIGPIRAREIRNFRDFSEAEKEIRFIEKHRLRVLFLTDPDYPRRLLHCYDSPTILYAKGDADFNPAKSLAVIGTRHHSDYGKQQADKIIQELAGHGISIISGMAYGIDAIAHKAALRYQLPTVGVVAHGLDQVYPADHQGLAREMINQGGALLTEYRYGTAPDKHHFPARNRIVAGMSDATLVIETGERGGSMITAELANGYHRDVLALPGRISDTKSAGCNLLIKQNKAQLITGAADILQLLGWEPAPAKTRKSLQRNLFTELSPEEQVITRLLDEKEELPIDELHLQAGLSNSVVAAALLNLELQNVVVTLPGKRYRLA